MPGVIDPDDYDPAYNPETNGNYEDWIMLVRDVDKLTPKMIDHQIIIEIRFRRALEGGAKMKKGEQPKLDLKALGLVKPVTKLRIRRIGS